MAEESRAASRIDQLEKNAAVGQLSSIFAHEMNVPLGSLRNTAHGIRVSLEEAYDEANPETLELLFEIDERLKSMEDEIQRAADIVTRVRGYAKNKHAEPKPIEVNGIIRRVITEYCQRRGIESGIEFHRTETAITVFADPVEFELIILNLLKNAYEAAAKEPSPRVTVTVTPDSEGVRITVTDNGPEVDDGVLSAMNGGKSETDKTDGLGLGLRIVTSLVERYSGQIRFRKILPSGLEAEVFFPTGSARIPREQTPRPHTETGRH